MRCAKVCVLIGWASKVRSHGCGSLPCLQCRNSKCQMNLFSLVPFSLPDSPSVWQDGCSPYPRFCRGVWLCGIAAVWLGAKGKIHFSYNFSICWVTLLSIATHKVQGWGLKVELVNFNTCFGFYLSLTSTYTFTFLGGGRVILHSNNSKSKSEWIFLVFWLA